MHCQQLVETVDTLLRTYTLCQKSLQNCCTAVTVAFLQQDSMNVTSGRPAVQKLSTCLESGLDQQHRPRKSHLTGSTKPGAKQSTDGEYLSDTGYA